MLRKYITDETLIEHIIASEKAFPLYTLEIEEILAEGDLVSIRGVWNATHRGEFMGIPATGNTIHSSVFVTYRVVAGKIVDHWMIMDSADILRQLGVPQAQLQAS